jgi:hypothetical protein
VLTGVVVKGTGATELGDIEVEGGRSVHGRVVGADGAPVGGVEVSVSTNSRSVDLSLRAELDGARGARTDAAGRFEIDGLPEDLTDAKIGAADADRGRAMPQPLDEAALNSEIVLQLEATGEIVGSVANEHPNEIYRVHIDAMDEASTYVAHLDHGEFSVNMLPPGDYVVALRGDVVLPPQRVHVTGGASTPVAFEIPAESVSLDVTTPNDTCTGIAIASIEVDHPLEGEPRWSAFAKCDDAHHAVIDHIAAGTYQLCNSSCQTVQVAPSPAHQAVTLLDATSE